MPQRGKLLAWIEPRSGDEFLAAFVGGAATERAPATELCASPDVGVLQKVFDNSVRRSYWHAELDRAYTGCNRLLLHLGGDGTYSGMVKLQVK